MFVNIFIKQLNKQFIKSSFLFFCLVEKMESTITFKRDSKNVKKILENGVFLIYAPRQLKISPNEFGIYDTEVTVILPKKSCRYFTSRFKTDEIEQVCGDTHQI